MPPFFYVQNLLKLCSNIVDVLFSFCYDLLERQEMKDYDYDDGGPKYGHRTVECPVCGAPVQIHVFRDWIEDRRDGWDQVEVEHQSCSCDFDEQELI